VKNWWDGKHQFPFNRKTGTRFIPCHWAPGGWMGPGSSLWCCDEFI